MAERLVDPLTGFVRYRRTPEEESIRSLMKEVSELKRTYILLEERVRGLER